MGIVYKVFVGADNINRALALVRGETSHEGPDIPPVMNLLNWYQPQGWVLLTATDGARLIADTFNAEIEHAGFLGPAEYGENDDEKRALAKGYLDEKGHEVSGRFERIGDLDEDLLRDGYEGVVGSATLFTLDDQSQEVIDYLVENKVAFTLEIECEDIKGVMECEKDDLLRQYGDWVEYGKGTWRIEIL